MALSDDVRKLNKDINDLKKQLGRTDFVNIKDLKSAQDIFKSLKNDVREMNSDLAYITDSFKQSVNELSKQNIFLSQAKSSLKSISNISQKLLDIKSGEVEADEKQIKLLQQQSKAKYDLINQAIRLGDLSDEETAELKDQLQTQKDFIKGSNEVLKLQKEINKDKGVKLFSGLDEISQAIPGLSKFTSGFQDASKAAKEQARENEIIKEGLEKQNLANTKKYQTQLKQRKLDLESLKSGKGLNKEAIKRLGLEKQLVSKSGEGIHHAAAAAKANKIGAADMVKDLKAPAKVTAKMTSPLKAGFKALGPMIKKAFGPLFLISTFITSLFEADKQVVELQKSMALSATEAVQFRSNLAGAAAATNDINITATALNKSFASLSKQFGFIAKFSNATLITTTKLTEVVGVSAEAANNLAAASVSSGVEFESAYKNSLGISYELQMQEGVQFSNLEILEEMGKVTGTVRANLGANIENIAKAVTQAKLFGASLQQVADAGRQLLDFEQSIKNELKAELLLGRDINLERARLAALNGDQVTLAQELRKEAGDYTEFTNMNVIQQEALAAAMGMQSDQLADILFQQDIQGKTENELRALGKDELADRLEKQTSQEKFNKSIEKLKDIFVDVFTAISPILNVFADIFKIVGFIVAPIGALISGANKLNSVLGVVVSLITAAAAAALFFNASLTAGIGVAATLAAVGIGMAYFNDNVKQVDDGISPPGYGKRTLITPKGAFALNNNDTVIAGTNLFRGNDVYSGPEGSLSMGADSTLLKELIMETKKANNTRREIGNKTVGALDEQGRRQIYSS